MKVWKLFFAEKMALGGLLAVIVALALFGLAFMGSAAGAKPRDLPVGLAVLDQPAQTPGGDLFVGGMLKEKLLAADMPVRWTVLSSEAEARRMMDDEELYGALVLPADLSAGAASLLSPEPKQAVLTAYVNEGLQSQAAMLVGQLFGQVAANANAELSGMMLDRLDGAAQSVPVGAAKALLAPIALHTETVHPVGANNAGGNAPNLLVQISWVGSLAASAFGWILMRRTREAGGGGIGTIAAQLLFGAVLSVVSCSLLTWMAAGWYGMELGDAAAVWTFLLLVAFAFFLLQSTLFNWLGLPAAGILVLLMFFSMPVIGVPAQFLPAAAHDWIYSWVPFRFAASGLRNMMYFGGTAPLSDYALIMGCIAGGFLLLLLASAAKRKPAGKPVRSASA